MSLKPVLAVVLAATFIAGGSFAVSVADLLSPAHDDAVELVPPDVAIYANVFLDPSAPQKLALDDLLAHFPGAENRDAARDRIVELLEVPLAEVGLSFDADIDPWLGDQIAFFMQVPAGFTSEPGVALLIEAEDLDAALAAVDKAQAADAEHTFRTARYQGVDYEIDQNGDAIGAVGSFLVSGTETGLKSAIDAHEGRSLAGSDRFETALAGLNDDRLALAYLDPAAFAQLAVGFPGGAGFRPPGTAGPFNLLDQGALAFILYARGDALVVEGSSQLPQDPALAGAIRGAARESKMLERLPGDAWFAFGVPDLGSTVRALLTAFETAFAQPQGGAFPGFPPGGLFGGLEATLGVDVETDLLAWMGDAAFFVSGKRPDSLRGGVVIEAIDPRKARQALQRLRARAERLGAPVRGSTFDPPGEGFALKARDMPEPFNVIAADERVLAIYGDAATGFALGSDPSLAGTPTFENARASLGDGYALAGFVDLSVLSELLERAGVMDAPYGPQIKMWTEPLSFISFGTKIEGNTSLQRVVLGVR